MLTHFLDLLAAVISVTSLLIVTYGALIGIISFLKNEIRRFTGGYSTTNIRKLRATFGTYRHSCISPWQYNHVIQRLWTL